MPSSEGAAGPSRLARAHDLLLLSPVLRIDGDSAGVRLLLEKSPKIHRDVGAREQLASDLSNRAEVLRALGRTDDAPSKLERARGLLTRRLGVGHRATRTIERASRRSRRGARRRPRDRGAHDRRREGPRRPTTSPLRVRAPRP